MHFIGQEQKSPGPVSLHGFNYIYLVPESPGQNRQPARVEAKRTDRGVACKILFPAAEPLRPERIRSEAEFRQPVFECPGAE